MKRWLITTLAAAALWVGATPARAGFGIGGSIGTGFFKSGDFQRINTNLEVLPFYKIGILSADLGILFHLESPREFLLRPGVRLDLWVLYARAAVPLQLTGNTDYGFLVGLGKSFGVGPVGIFLEADVNFTKNFGSSVLVEFRAGVQFSF